MLNEGRKKFGIPAEVLYFWTKGEGYDNVFGAMAYQKRPFQTGILNHCYVPSADGGVLFYSYSDYLVWFSIVCVEARRHCVKLLAVCPMPDHIHLSVVAASRRQLAAFMRDILRKYSAQFNAVSGLNGPVFQPSFGSAPKLGAKKGRTNLIYVWNNPVERQLSARAEDYRWTFLAYARSSHPFSEELVMRKARRAVQDAVKEIRGQFLAGLVFLFVAGGIPADYGLHC